MNYRYRLTNDPRNDGIQYRMVNGAAVRKDRWLITHLPLNLQGIEELVEMTTESGEEKKVEAVAEPIAVSTEEPKTLAEFGKRTSLEIYGILRNRGFPESELEGLSKPDMLRMLAVDEELEEEKENAEEDS